MSDSKPHEWTRRTFLKAGATALGGAVALPALGACASTQTTSTAVRQPGKRPNILVIVTDQQNIDTIAAHRSYFDHAAHGCGWVQTPNLDRLARRGVSFMESHSANPVCCPARSAIFTGRMACETGVNYNNIGIAENVPNMGQWFEKHSDYDRVYCGKWHAGGQWNYPNIDGPRKVPGFDTMPVGARGTGDVADYGVSSSTEAYVRNHKADNPFLIVAGLMNPHDICYFTDPLAGRVTTPHTDVFNLGDDGLPPLPPNNTYDFAEPDDHGLRGFGDTRWRTYAYAYYRMIEKIDADVGRMMDAVDSRNDDTIIVFTSDHGEGLGRHRRVSKWHPYDESVRVPLMVSCPGRMAEDVIDTTHLVSGIDIMATLCDYAGIPAPPHTRGSSLRPLLTGHTDAPWREHIYAEMFHTGRMIRTERFKYVKFYEYSGEEDQPFVRADGTPSAFVQGHGADYKENPIRMLFDMENDPWETRNLIADRRLASVVAEHEQYLREWEATLIPGVHFDRN